jgi:hypothetical protein
MAASDVGTHSHRFPAVNLRAQRATVRPRPFCLKMVAIAPADVETPSPDHILRPTALLTKTA